MTWRLLLASVGIHFCSIKVLCSWPPRNCSTTKVLAAIPERPRASAEQTKKSDLSVNAISWTMEECKGAGREVHPRSLCGFIWHDLEKVQGHRTIGTRYRPSRRVPTHHVVSRFCILHRLVSRFNRLQRNTESAQHHSQWLGQPCCRGSDRVQVVSFFYLFHWVRRRDISFPGTENKQMFSCYELIRNTIGFKFWISRFIFWCIYQFTILYLICHQIYGTQLSANYPLFLFAVLPAVPLLAQEFARLRQAIKKMRL